MVEQKVCTDIYVLDCSIDNPKTFATGLDFTAKEVIIKAIRYYREDKGPEQYKIEGSFASEISMCNDSRHFSYPKLKYQISDLLASDTVTISIKDMSDVPLILGALTIIVEYHGYLSPNILIPRIRQPMSEI